MPAPASLVEKVRQEAKRNWRPYGIRMRGVTVRKVPELTPAQCQALASVASYLPRTAKLKIQQTWSESGGTHLYACTPVGDEFHIAANGNITDLGAR